MNFYLILFQLTHGLNADKIEVETSQNRQLFLFGMILERYLLNSVNLVWQWQQQLLTIEIQNTRKYKVKKNMLVKQLQLQLRTTFIKKQK